MISYNFPGSQRSSYVVRSTRHLVVLALSTAGLSIVSALSFSGYVAAKTPGKSYCFRGTCHRVKTLHETKALVGRDIKISASFYDACSKDRFNSCGLTSSGEVYRPNKADNAASSILPDGTVALVWSQTSGEAIVLRINNAGPYWGDRKLDLSAAAAKKLGIKGVEDLTIRIVKAPTDLEARYEKNRSYDPVIGPLGRFASLELAQKAMKKIRSDGLKKAPSLANLDKPLPPSVPDFDIASLGEPVQVNALTYQEEVRGRGLSLSRNPGGIKLLHPLTEVPDLLVETSPLHDQGKSGSKNFVAMASSAEELQFGEGESPSSKSALFTKTIQTAELSDIEAQKLIIESPNDMQNNREETTSAKPMSLLAALSTFTLNKFSMFADNTDQDPVSENDTNIAQIDPLKQNEERQKASTKKFVAIKVNKKTSSGSEGVQGGKIRPVVKVASLASSSSGESKVSTPSINAKKSPSQAKGESASVKSKKKET